MESRGILQSADALQDAEPDVLHQLVGRVSAAGDAADVTLQGHRPASDQVVEGRSLAELAAHRQERIGAGVGGFGNDCGVSNVHA